MIVDPRFSGPPGSGNGGYVAGLAASYVGGVAEVTLRLPPPLGTELAVGRDGDGVRLTDDGRVVVEAVPADLELDLPAPVGFEEATEARSRYPWHDGGHPFPTCFVCCPDRDDGLRLFPGAVRDGAVAATTWVPDASLPTDDGVVREEVVWAALDCPSYYGGALGLPGQPTAVLGRMTARVDSRPQVGDRLVVMGWGLGVDRRKVGAGSALLTERGEVLAVARAVWILLDGDR